MSSSRLRSDVEVRICGSCTACCTHLPLFGGEGPCPHAGALGCRIYSRRPEPCARFACQWLRDPLWPAPWRPDRAGLLCLREVIEGAVAAAEVYEICPGALKRPEAAEILKALARTAATISIVDGEGINRPVRAA